MASSEPSSLALAQEVLGYSMKTLSQEDVDQLKRLVLDWCGVVAKGTSTPWGQKLNAWAEANAGGGKATIAGSGLKRAAAATALVNGTIAHGYELDDTHDASMSHPGAVVITAAMAVAGQIGAKGEDVLPAIAAGYEVMARVGMAANALETLTFGYHPTATFGVFGAAAAAAHLKKLSAEQLAMAWGHALSMTSGSLQFSQEPLGTMVKRMHAGLPAHNGVLAAELAELGVTAPMKAIEGQYGFLALYGKNARPERLTKAKGEKLEIHGVSIKPYSCCRKFHSLIDALGEATGGKVDADAIESITVLSPIVSIEQHQQRRPDSVMAAQYSMPYIVGATLAYGSTRYDAYDTAHHKDPKILSIIDKVQPKREASFEPHYPEHMGNAVEIKMKDGSVKTASVLDSRGTPYRPIDVNGIREKAAGLMATVDASLDVAAVEKAVWALDKAPGVDGLMSLLVVKSAPRATAAAE